MYNKKSPKSEAKMSCTLGLSKENSFSEEFNNTIIPKQIKVGGITYDIEIVDSQMSSDNNVGLTDYRDAKIYISRNNSIAFMEETFIHELIHAMLAHAGYVDHDELMVESLAQTLYGVIKDNVCSLIDGEYNE